MEGEITIALQLKLAIGDVTLDEIVCRLKEFRSDLMLRILAEILENYDDLICERLTQTRIYPSKARRGLGRHFNKDDPEGRWCQGRKARKRAYRSNFRHLLTQSYR